MGGPGRACSDVAGNHVEEMLNKRSVVRNSRRRGQAAIETALMVPWILLLFILIFDFGFYAYAGAATANAARSAALVTARSIGSADSKPTACLYAKRELSMMPNVSSSCDSLPLIVSAQSVTGPDGHAASRVAVTYQTVQLFPLPWLMGRMTLTQVSEVRVYR